MGAPLEEFSKADQRAALQAAKDLLEHFHMTRKSGGRPQVIDDFTLGKVVALRDAGIPITAICKEMGLSRKTLYRALERCDF